ncbi:MAG: diphosphomevalonate decarboxylase, partial [Holophagae bacterium]
MTVTAVAHPNIALVKYWGKADVARNIPAVGSISITLDQLTTTTTVEPDASLAGDRFVLDGSPASEARAARVRGCLDLIRELRPALPPVRVASRNSFPTAAGLASSASGFAALVTAADALVEPGLTLAERAEVARRCSGSAPRSLVGGFAELVLADDGTELEALRSPDEWPLEVVVAVTSSAEKA